MTRLQGGVVGIATILVLLLFFGFDTKSPKQKDLLRSQELAGTKIEIRTIKEAAKESLSPKELKNIQALEIMLESGTLNNEQRSERLKQLSSAWYDSGYTLIAGNYAETVAELDLSGEAWGIAGTTYLAGIQNEDPLIRNGSFQGAVRSLENAISLEPDTIKHRVNLALAYTENPPQENPMKGIQMLLSLNERYPGDIVVLNTLARLATKTGQLERAVERLKQVLTIDPRNATANCLLAEVLAKMQDPEAENQRKKCELLTTKE